MIRLALRMLRHRPGSALATFLALTVGATILVSMAVLVESGLLHRPEPRHYAAADLVVARPELAVTGKDLDGTTLTSRVDLPEGGTLAIDLAQRLRRVPGVTAAVADRAIPLFTPAGPATGHGWDSAALAPYRLVDGRAPQRDDEVVLDAGTAAGAAPGTRTEMVIGGVAASYRISGIVEATAPRVFFTEGRATALAPRPDRVDAIGLTLAPGADRGAVDRLAAEAGTEVYAGAARGRLERTGDTVAAGLLVQIGASFGGYVVMLVVFVVAGTVGLSVRHRRRDFALLRAIAATPAQVRRMVMAEAALIGVAGVASGVPAGLFATRWVQRELTARAFLPDGFPLAPGLLSAAGVALTTILVAVLAALVAARRVTGIRPVEALGEVAVEPGGRSRVRLISGLVVFAGAAGSSTVTVGAGGQVALAGAIGMLYLYVMTVALLAPWINRAATRLLQPLLSRIWGAGGHLAVANLRANARGTATVLTGLVLAVGFGGSVWFLQDNIERSAVVQARDGMLASWALSSPAGLAPTTAAKARELPGVQAVSAVRRTSVVVKIFGGEAETVPVMAVDDVSAFDLGVDEGSMADLRGPAMAVSAIRAGSQGWHLGEEVALWLGDGTPVTLRVAAIYERGLGFGDIVLPRDVVTGHTAGDTDDEVLVTLAPGAVVDPRLATLGPAATLVDTGRRTGRLAADLTLSAWLNKMLVGVMVGYAVLAVANTMVMAALARRRELALLRIVGVTPRQARRMVRAEQAGLLGVALVIGGTIAALTLVAVVHALTGDLVPYVPPLGLAVVVGGTALLALTTTILPIGYLLRTPPLEHLGVKE
ncbi:putative ABC transport system permease protein [Actinoplanes octamycinicus]|uniref:Putative ABC transport system permease protein n=1 Tax=Actinoplanes octamycinicus TaxID=135948 RepID=A0A7W7GTE7_9ACTN|nr:FtsX-like permease family protein [Actinoplanes octamycinicus]MBB4737983.1 putative ABC transport system permease protein [Actinoplanes octamycinicus]GIE58967.1 membrane protein [Actinoplanes octamycinicus]